MEIGQWPGSSLASQAAANGGWDMKGKKREKMKPHCSKRGQKKNNYNKMKA